MKLSDFNTLAEAKAYTNTQPRLIHRDTMNSLLASAGLYVAFQDMAKDSANPFQDLIAAFLDSVEYNFMIGNTTGDRQILALDSMIAAGGNLGTALAALKPVILSIANPTVTPFANATLHDWKVATDDQTRFKQISTVDKQHLIITTTTDCESHRPSVYQLIGTQYVRFTSFGLVEAAGEYQAFINNRTGPFYVDDAYGVVA